MKKHVVCLLIATAAFSTVLASCSIGGSSQESATKAAHSAMSYSERASYYDQLVAGDNDPIPLTTALNSSVSIEGDINLLEEEPYQRLVELSNQVFPRMRAKYAERASLSITITLDGSSAGYSPYYAAGNTVVINTDWLNSHPQECDAVIEAFAAIIFNYSSNASVPDWLRSAIKIYVRDEYGLYRGGSSFRLPQRYNGKSYEKDSYSGAAFLKWIKESKQVDIVERLNRHIRSYEGYKDEIWKLATDKTLDQLWTEYTNA